MLYCKGFPDELVTVFFFLIFLSNAGDGFSFKQNGNRGLAVNMAINKEGE